MSAITPRLLRGFQDFLPEVMIPRQRMIAAVTAVFERFGFAPLQTPALEYADILLGKYGEEGEKLLYRFRDNGGRDVALRYDLTVPLARVVAQYGQALPMPFKRYQVGPVWRADRPQRGRFREFVQCDVDIVGSDSLLADAECVAVDYAVMKAIGELFGGKPLPVEIRINNRKVLRGLQEMIGTVDETQFGAFLRALDKLDRQGPDTVRAQLASEAGLESAGIEAVLGLIGAEGDNGMRLAAASERLGESAVGAEGIAELQEVVASAQALGVPATALVVDFSIARGLDYYTGTVFETFMDDLPNFGSVMSGGRYDGLVGLYARADVPAVGISVGLDRLLAGLAELGRLPTRPSTALVLVTVFDESDASRAGALATARALREAGIATEQVLLPGKLKKQLKYADRQGIPWVAIQGPDERARGTVTLKALATGKQETLPMAGAVARLRAAESV